MHHITESHILLFLLQVLVLLGCARTLSVLCESIKIPSIAGEILAGVLLGPTLFGRLAPTIQGWLFPGDLTQSTMLETVSWLGVFFLLLVSGFHVNLKQSFQGGRAALLIGIIGVIFPIAIGYPIFSFFDAAYWGDEATALVFALFLSVAGSITAISVVARIIGDLEINNTPQATLALSACAINDLFGWFLFTLVLSLTTSHAMSAGELVRSSLGIIGFITISFVFGGRILDYALGLVQKTRLAQPAAAQTLIVSVGILCGAITQWLGIHAILGFFIAGIIVSSSTIVTNELRNSISETLHAIFVPLFFATLGLKIDFLTGMEIWPTLIFTAVAIFGKFGGAWLGARIGNLSSQTSILMGLIFVPGGAMEIVVATLAFELQLIGQTIFVAIVFAALISSIFAGPLIGIQVRNMGLASKQSLAKVN